ncbi:multicopper oxidase family protein [Rhodococcus triatomae]|uniref:Multicopper oxidase with three cupredoxin domains (Includes cell division protein FtsP and spore coat protein CotA) n=1 Tax=Rhodococcus triatomae TaxID=300028 RepID=A0A1G8A681_9NOCA|nr:multicopper oxidase family protein [Rhodococcus triatomae]QNG17848.1 multicopper oxidase family protein [Rhodococcus triatomae]QNG22484.1 multicopper oxidase family protein [Rhodococcus triatomae]SDH16366.1 Multicopper oxidase with three cupredoxin domains (includes cell division protein FtsP and spore coat protein CotA) [Rhodococcus triatomae]
MTRPDNGSVLGRRRFLALGSLGAGAVGLGALGFGAAGCSPDSSGAQSAAADLDYILPTDPEVAAAEAARETSGDVAAFALSAGFATVDLGGRLVDTWAYGGNAVAPELRMTKGDRVDVTVANGLDADTTLHWHGIRIRNDMDGAAPVTQPPIRPGTTFDYSFVVPDPGTHWYHSHSGLQADRGLFGAFVVEDPDDTTGADVDAVLVLDDWVDGMGTTPEAVLMALNPDISGGHGGHGGHGGSSTPATHTDSEMAVAVELISAGHGNSVPLGGMTQHVAYPLHLINGRPPNDPDPIVVPPGSRLRLRVVNAAAETPYRFAVAGHEMTVVAADGFDTVPRTTDTLIIGMAQRYDVLVTVASGTWPVVAKVEGRDGYASTVLRTDDAAPMANPDVGGSIPELAGRLLAESELRPAESVTLERREPDRDYRVELIQAGDRYVWGMAGVDAGKLIMREGERIRITMTNTSTMWHPMHTHGHTFAVGEYGGLRRDTVNVLPGTELAIEFDADNPGEWMFHCHNAYHFEAGMTANLRYIR